MTMYDLLEDIIQRIDPVRSTEALSCIYARHSQREIFHICTEHTRTLAASVQVDQWANFFSAQNQQETEVKVFCIESY